MKNLAVKALLVGIFASGFGVSFAIAGPASTQAKKVAICHYTRVARKPYIRLLVSPSNAALHKRRHRFDIVPTPPTGCPPGARTVTVTEPGETVTVTVTTSPTSTTTATTSSTTTTTSSSTTTGTTTTSSTTTGTTGTTTTTGSTTTTTP